MLPPARWAPRANEPFDDGVMFDDGETARGDSKGVAAGECFGESFGDMSGERTEGVTGTLSSAPDCCLIY